MITFGLRWDLLVLTVVAFVVVFLMGCAGLNLYRPTCADAEILLDVAERAVKHCEEADKDCPHLRDDLRLAKLALERECTDGAGDTSGG